MNEKLVISSLVALACFIIAGALGYLAYLSYIGEFSLRGFVVSIFE